MVRKIAREKINYFLVFSTFIFFLLWGLIFLFATFYIWNQTRLYPGWENSLGYLEYVEKMNPIATIPGIAIIFLLLLCIERKSVKLIFATVLVGITVVTALILHFSFGYRASVALISVVVSSYQLALAILVLMKKPVLSSKTVSVEKFGSLIMHTGYSLLVLAWVSLQATIYEMQVFYTALTFVTAGSVLSFFGENIFRRFSVNSDSELS